MSAPKIFIILIIISTSLLAQEWDMSMGPEHTMDLEMFMTQEDGSEFKSMEMLYTKRK